MQSGNQPSSNIADVLKEPLAPELSGQRPERPIVQKYLFFLLFLAGFWLSLGRAFFDTGGWLVLITLFMYAPVILIYSIIVSVVANFKYGRSGYIFDPMTKLVAVGLLVSMFVFGLSIVDGGDTRESGKSVLTNMFGINLANGENSPIMALSETLTELSFWAVIVLGLVLFVLVITGRSHKPNVA